MSTSPTLPLVAPRPADAEAAASVLRAVDVEVAGAPRPLLPRTTLTVSEGEVAVAVGEPGHGHTALALVLAGRLSIDRGTVVVDGQGRPAELQRLVALVDVPGVSEPDGNLRLRAVVGEELAIAGRPAGRASIRACIEQHGLADLGGRPIEEVPASRRTRLLADLAALRPGVRFLVIALPERFGGSPATWLGDARGLAARGFGVVVTASHATAGSIDHPTVLIGGGEPR